MAELGFRRESQPEQHVSRKQYALGGTLCSLFRTRWPRAEAVLSTTCILFLYSEVSISAVSVRRPGMVRHELGKGMIKHQAVLALTAMELHIHWKSMLTSFTGLVEESWFITL